MASSLRSTLWQCMEVLEAVDAHPEQLLSVQESLASDFSKLTKALYDLHKVDGPVIKGSPLTELVINNFDEEQIWQQLELQNRAVLSHFKEIVSNAVTDKDITILEEEEEEEDFNDDDNEMSEIDQGEEEVAPEDPAKDHEVHQSKRNGKLPLSKRNKKAAVERYSDDDSDMDFDIDRVEKENAVKKTKKEPAKKSIVDDQFFKLSEMEAFLEAVEKEDDEKNKDDDEEEVDYFEDIDSYDDEEEEDFDILETKKVAKSARNLEYKDFFDDVEDDENGLQRKKKTFDDEDNEEEMDDSADDIAENDLGIDEEDEDAEVDDDEHEMQETDESKKAKEDFKRVTFDLSDDSEGEDVYDILGGKKKDEKPKEPNEVKSSFEKREEKMAEKIQALQKQMLEEKSWQLHGEVTAQKRPENSLLSESLVFDHATRMAPVVTEETTLQLEDVIKQRIKDQVWDDVVRKEKPKEDAFEYKKRLTLDQDKSKLSLAEIYEQEYLKQHQKKTEEEENPNHVEIQKLMDSLFLKLDALSNFHFTPKPAVPDIKVVSNLPAIIMEEVAPVGVSEAALLAPEEIKEKNKSGDLKTKSEMTATDKNRERRKKKVAKKFKIKEREKRQKMIEMRRAEKGKKLTKKDAAANLKKLAKEGKATLLKDEGKDKALKSSQAFFSQLQDQVKLQIKDAKTLQKKQKKNKELSVHKLKL